jgi:thiaminase/transcriptional activator TenA
VLSVAAARAQAEGDITMFNEHAAGAIAVERSLHALLRPLRPERGGRGTPMAPTNLAYTSYLIATAYGGSFPELLGAVLPCNWIHWEVGKALLERGSPDPLYGRWIETYGGEEFAEVVRAVLALTDRLGRAQPSGARECWPSLRHHEPVRVDVLGHGLSARGLADHAEPPAPPSSRE